MSKNKSTEAAEPQTGTALVPATQETALSTSFAADLAADAAEFGTQFSREDMTIPFLYTLQSNTPAAQEGGPGHVEGAKPGLFFNSATKEVLGKQVMLVPAHYEKTFIEWILREEGGGFIKNHGYGPGLTLMRQATKDDKGRSILDNGHQLVETAQYAIVIAGNDGPIPMLLAMTSTQLKKSRNWNSLMDNVRATVGGKKIKPPIFYMTYAVTTVYESNDKGSWWGLKIEPAGAVTDLGQGGAELYAAAKALRQSIESGAVSVDRSTEAAAGVAEEDGGPTPF